ncbi:YczE/YyaS/YitT family protein [Alkaliphilus crotonatoxidans]
MNSIQKREWIELVRKLPSLFLGYFLYALAVLLMRDAGLGMNPWGVFHMGVSLHTPLTLGQVTQLMGLVILTGSMALKVTPGLGSVGDMVFIGFIVDLIDSLKIISTPETLAGKMLMLLTGILIIGWGSYFYLRVRLGAGPRDGLMEGLVKKTGKPVWLIRGSIEVTVLTIGYLLGGPVGLGTLFAATAIGPSVQLAFKIGHYDSKAVEHINCIELYKKLKGQFPKEEAC